MKGWEGLPHLNITLAAFKTFRLPCVEDLPKMLDYFQIVFCWDGCIQALVTLLHKNLRDLNNTGFNIFEEQYSKLEMIACRVTTANQQHFNSV
jgi:hypothetical protein